MVTSSFLKSFDYIYTYICICLKRLEKQISYACDMHRAQSPSVVTQKSEVVSFYQRGFTDYNTST